MVLELLGSGYEFSAVGQAEYPDSTNVKAMRCRSTPYVASPENQGAFDDIANELNAYSLALLVVEYEVIEPADPQDDMPEIENGTFLQYRMDFGGEFMDLPTQGLHWAAAPAVPVPEEAKPTLRIPIIEHHMAWSHVITPPWDAIRNLIGRVNATEFLGVSIRELLFSGAKASKEFISVDQLQEPQYSWKLDYLFKQRTIHTTVGTTVGWNYSYRSLPAGGAGVWDRLVDSNGGEAYQDGDFTRLFVGAATA
jgi:hypothetical protein